MRWHRRPVSRVAESRRHARAHRADSSRAPHSSFRRPVAARLSPRRAITNGATRPTSQVVICVHGLSRNGRDFDVLGEALAPTASRARGRHAGTRREPVARRSQRLHVPDLSRHADRARSRAAAPTRVSWVGTSMGALLGMVMAAQPNTPVARLVVNDAGPLIEPAALARIRDYLGLDPTFATVGGGGRLHPQRLGAVWRAHRRAMGPSDADQRRAACRTAATA